MIDRTWAGPAPQPWDERNLKRHLEDYCAQAQELLARTCSRCGMTLKEHGWNQGHSAED